MVTAAVVGIALVAMLVLFVAITFASRPALRRAHSTAGSDGPHVGDGGGSDAPCDAGGGADGGCDGGGGGE